MESVELRKEQFQEDALYVNPTMLMGKLEHSPGESVFPLLAAQATFS